MAPDQEEEYDAALEDVLTTLRKEYLNELPQRFSELRNCIQLAKESQEKQHEALAKAHTVAHKLAGTAGSYGLTELSVAAAAFDSYCKQLFKEQQNSMDTAPDWEKIEAMGQAIYTSTPEVQ